MKRLRLFLAGFIALHLGCSATVGQYKAVDGSKTWFAAWAVLQDRDIPKIRASGGPTGPDFEMEGYKSHTADAVKALAEKLP